MTDSDVTVEDARKYALNLSANTYPLSTAGKVIVTLGNRVDALEAELVTAVQLLRNVVAAEKLEPLPGDHAISVVLSLSVDEFLAGAE